MNEKRPSERIMLYYENNRKQLEVILSSGVKRIVFRIHPALRKAYREYLDAEAAGESTELKNDRLRRVLNAWDNNPTAVLSRQRDSKREDRELEKRYGAGREIIDRSDKTVKDYYSVAMIIKDQAMYIREWVLFYKATGADRIYIYDNDSSDNLREELEPFINSGYVIYTKWPGKAVQASAYRDAIRRTTGRTTWLALVDSDEFLFSPKGSMPDVLKAYEKYPGVGANWVCFGPSGHDRRPEGLVIDNYTETMADRDCLMNCHIKSIVQPGEVVTMQTPHYARYKNGRLAVNARKEEIDNYCSVRPGQGYSFTAHNDSEIFRVNHYITRSIQDLEEKCARGYPDGTPKAELDKQLEPFNVPLTEDYSIKKYADIVRAAYANDLE